MYRGTLHEAGLAPILYGLQADLDAFTNCNVLADEPGALLEVCTSQPLADNGELSDQIHATFSAANSVIQDFNDCPQPPQFLLTATAVDAANERDTPVCIDRSQDALCFEAELRVVRSLRLNEQGKTLPQGHAPAAVAFDTDDVPYGYLKSSGRHVGLAWRTATVETGCGYQRIPAGSFFSLEYGEEGEDDIQDRSRSDGQDEPGLISLRGTESPTDITLHRFSALLVRQELARAAYLFAMGPPGTDRHDSLAEYVPETLDLTLAKLSMRVHDLLRADVACRAA